MKEGLKTKTYKKGDYGTISLKGKFEVEVSKSLNLIFTVKDGGAVMFIGHPPPPGGRHKEDDVPLKKGDTITINPKGDLGFPDPGGDAGGGKRGR